jgi:hypothetical protein
VILNMSKKRKLRAGELVEVLTKDEILATLDKKGQLDGLPFMPEMFAYCGKRLRVSKRAHKTCDPSLGLGGRKLPDTVHLEDVRCNGQAHDGCEAGCLIFWKEAWIKRVGAGSRIVSGTMDQSAPSQDCKAQYQCTEADVLTGTKMAPPQAQDGTIYVCQNTQLKHATQPLPWWDLRQFWEDYASGNVRVPQMIAAFVFTIWHTLSHAGIGIGSAMVWIYDSFQRLRGGSPYPWRRGKIFKGSPTPTQKLDLQPGELVRVRPYAEILESLDQNAHNRGMYFDGEMVPFSGGTFRVLKRVGQIIDERTGRMVKIKSDAIILENVACQARYAKCRRFCPRSIYPYWREIWLERVAERNQENVE